MAYQSPYRGNPTFTPRTRELIGRGTMALIGIVLLYFGTRGTVRLNALSAAAATQPGVVNVAYSPVRRPDSVAPVLPWVVTIGLGVLGFTLLVAALLPVATMQAMYERVAEPPVTGDRGGTDLSYGRTLFGYSPWWLRALTYWTRRR